MGASPHPPEEPCGRLALRAAQLPCGRLGAAAREAAMLRRAQRNAGGGLGEGAALPQVSQAERVPCVVQQKASAHSSQGLADTRGARPPRESGRRYIYAHIISARICALPHAKGHLMGKPPLWKYFLATLFCVTNPVCVALSNAVLAINRAEGSGCFVSLATEVESITFAGRILGCDFVE